MWRLVVIIMSKYSYYSSYNKSDLFLNMFSGINIAKNLASGKRKRSYILKFRLSSYFLKLLNSELNNASHYVALFDESYNNVAKENQIDLHIRYCYFQKNVAVTQFYGSEFFGKSSATDILHGFESCLRALQKEKMIQISSDGLNVNLLFLDMIKDNRLTAELPNLIDSVDFIPFIMHSNIVNIHLDGC